MARKTPNKSRRKGLTLLKRGYQSIYHKFSPRYLDRCVTEFAGRHNDYDADTADRIAEIVAGMVGKRQRYRDLAADNGRSNGARR